MMLPNGWKKSKIGETCSLLSGQDFPPNLYGDEEKGLPYITGASNFAGNHIILNRWTEHPKNIAKKGDILLVCKGSGFGITAIADFEKAHIARQVMALQKLNGVDRDFLYQVVSMNVRNIKQKGCGLIPGIDRKTVLNIEYLLPPIEEQKKIAATLSVWDSAIEKMGKLIDAKEVSFNSLLKELIYSPAEKEHWNIVKLGDVSEMSSGGTPKSSIEKYYNGDVLWVSIADMTEQGMYIKDTAKKLTKLGIENSAAKIYPKGSVLYAMYASIGEVSIAEKEMASSQAILGIQVSDKLVNKYLYYFLVGQKERIKLQGQAGTQSNLNAGMVKNLDIPIPSIKEQNKIIAVLDNGMDELSLLKQQLENYKKQKQGLMQKLLTGQWRVK